MAQKTVSYSRGLGPQSPECSLSRVGVRGGGGGRGERGGEGASSRTSSTCSFRVSLVPSNDRTSSLPSKKYLKGPELFSTEQAGRVNLEL